MNKAKRFNSIMIIGNSYLHSTELNIPFWVQGTSLSGKFPALKAIKSSLRVRRIQQVLSIFILRSKSVFSVGERERERKRVREREKHTHTHFLTLTSLLRQELTGRERGRGEEGERDLHSFRLLHLTQRMNLLAHSQM